MVEGVDNILDNTHAQKDDRSNLRKIRKQSFQKLLKLYKSKKMVKFDEWLKMIAAGTEELVSMLNDTEQIRKDAQEDVTKGDKFFNKIDLENYQDDEKTLFILQIQRSNSSKVPYKKTSKIS